MHDDDTMMTATTCSSYILSKAREIDLAFTYSDLEGPLAYGTIRNTISKLTKSGKILKLPKENPARFILREWATRPEYSSVQINDRKGIAARLDLLSLLESLSWDSALSVHDLRLSFSVSSMVWATSSSGWEYHSKSHSWSRRFDLSYPVFVQCFDTSTVMVSIKSTVRPFRLDLDGLLSLSSLLGEIRARLAAPCIPEPSEWVVVQWHLGRDSKKAQESGLSFNLTFRDFFNNVAQFYFKRELSKVRAETVQAPKRTVKQVFEDILNRDQGA
jgi:hypothetical protein